MVTEEIVREIVARYLGKAVAEVDLDQPVEEAADSLELAVVLAQLEKHFGITLDDRVVGRLRVVRDLVREIEARIPTPDAKR